MHARLDNTVFRLVIYECPVLNIKKGSGLIKGAIGSIRPLSALPSRLGDHRIRDFPSRRHCQGLVGLNDCRRLLWS